MLAVVAAALGRRRLRLLWPSRIACPTCRYSTDSTDSAHAEPVLDGPAPAYVVTHVHVYILWLICRFPPLTS